MLISRFPSGNVEARIIEIEKKYSIIFPAQYRNFLVKYNGGDTPKTKYKAGRKSVELRGFYGFGNVRYSIDKFDNLQEWLVKGLFPIACDSFGNYIVIGMRNNIYGQIYFADHEKMFAPDLIEKELKAFIKKCEIQVIDKAAKRSIEEREADLITRGRGHVITDGLRQLWQAEIDKYQNLVQEEIIIE